MTVRVARRRGRRSQPVLPQPAIAARGWVWALAQVTLLGMLAFAVLLMLAQPAFRASTVKVSGLQQLREEEVSGALALPTDRNIFFLNHSTLERRVSALPWVRSARVRLLLPTRVEVAVQEWTPAAVLQEGEQAYYLNEQGRVLAPAHEAGRLMIVYRKGASPLRPGDFAVPADLVQLLRPLRDGFPVAFKLKVQSFSLDQRDMLSLRTDRGWTIIFGQMTTADQRATLEPKLAALRALGARVDLTTAPIDYINLMNPRAPAVQLKK
jgi:cell division septal protein FtsQ